jgi:hypothetical protein
MNGPEVAEHPRELRGSPTRSRSPLDSPVDPLDRRPRGSGYRPRPGPAAPIARSHYRFDFAIRGRSTVSVLIPSEVLQST